MTTTEISADTRAAARDLLGFYHLEGGTVPGGFRSTLFELWAKADRSNYAKLAAAFPEVAPAVGARLEGGIEALQKMAAGT